MRYNTSCGIKYHAFLDSFLETDRLRRTSICRTLFNDRQSVPILYPQIRTLNASYLDKSRFIIRYLELWYKPIVNPIKFDCESILFWYWLLTISLRNLTFNCHNTGQYLFSANSQCCYIEQGVWTQRKFIFIVLRTVELVHILCLRILLCRYIRSHWLSRNFHCERDIMVLYNSKLVLHYHHHIYHKQWDHDHST